MIRNYQNPEGTIVTLDGTSITDAKIVYTSSKDGGPVSIETDRRTTAVTTIALCNTGEVNLTDETEDAVRVNIWVVPQGKVASAGNRIVSDLVVPAGETVFLSEERIVLNWGDTIRVGTQVDNPASLGVTNLLAVTVSSLEV
jgi:hypothetical protein